MSTVDVSTELANKSTVPFLPRPPRKEEPSGREPPEPPFAIRIGDGAVLLDVTEYIKERDLSGRVLYVCMVLTEAEAQQARATIEHAEHAAAARIIIALPKQAS